MLQCNNIRNFSTNVAHKVLCKFRKTWWRHLKCGQKFFKSRSRGAIVLHRVHFNRFIVWIQDTNFNGKCPWVNISWILTDRIRLNPEFFPSSGSNSRSGIFWSRDPFLLKSGSRVSYCVCWECIRTDPLSGSRVWKFQCRISIVSVSGNRFWQNGSISILNFSPVNESNSRFRIHFVHRDSVQASEKPKNWIFKAKSRFNKHYFRIKAHREGQKTLASNFSRISNCKAHSSNTRSFSDLTDWKSNNF